MNWWKQSPNWNRKESALWAAWFLLGGGLLGWILNNIIRR
jgi:hypothetical protein